MSTSTVIWTEKAVVGAATIMLMTERQSPERVAAFLRRMAGHTVDPRGNVRSRSWAETKRELAGRARLAEVRELTAKP